MQDKGGMWSELTVVTRFGFVMFVSLNCNGLGADAVSHWHKIAAIQSQPTF